MKPKKEIARFKTGTCLTCNRQNVQLTAGRCINYPYCYKKHRNDISAVKNTKSLKSPEIKPKKVYISPISKTRAAATVKYRRLRDKYFIDHPVCQFPGCKSRHITLHHKRGRIGAFLTDKRYFCSLCQTHHTWVEENPAEAQKMNLSHKRLNK